jgi:hypothetical protein
MKAKRLKVRVWKRKQARAQFYNNRLARFHRKP